MSTPSDALLALAVGLAEIPEGEAPRPLLWANPLICTPALFEEALADADDDDERELLQTARREGYILIDPNPARAERRLHAPVKYLSRAERRAELRTKPRGL